MTEFDRSLLPAAQFEFVVIADTHYMLAEADDDEFDSRRHQTRRAAQVLQQVAALDPQFVVHMGDLVQEYPERTGFDRAQQEALDQLLEAGLLGRTHFVAGNHDVGDKPDDTMPTHPVTEDSLRRWERRVGRSWYRWDAGGVRFLVVNSQLLNTPLPAAREQRLWLETELASGEPTCLFLHLPPYLHRPNEPSLGHYDNVAELDRSWLLALIDAADVRWMFAAHVHFPFADPRGACRYRIVPSASFTRPGFGHLFASTPAPEHGRDDRGKLGFLLCRLRDGELDVHLVRTRGVVDPPTEGARLLTPVSPSASLLGLTVHHQLAPSGVVPVAYPSAIPQTVRNDIPRLSSYELGAGWLRLPMSEVSRLEPSLRRELREHGVRLQATQLGPALADGAQPGADRVELQIAGPWPNDTDLAVLRSADAPILCPVVPGQRVPGKQHPRTRIGYRLDELGELGLRLAAAGLAGVWAVCRYDHASSPVDQALQAQRLPAALAGLVWLCDLGEDDVGNHGRAVAALLVAAVTRTVIFLEPLRDFDRTMDTRHGLLDTLCNPRSTATVARCLSALLNRMGPGQLELLDTDGDGSLQLKGAGGSLRVWMSATVSGLSSEVEGICVDLVRGVRLDARQLSTRPSTVAVFEET
ncbi:MAG: metallophosphoesterase [Candidatus Latescibacterota bacterium]|nr:metallophosphoesterase [Candidatus Latescibacterota bacterium]